MKLSNKETALLGLLNERPMHGYEIEQEVKQRDMRYWTEISISSIYKVLKKLNDHGYVKAEIKLTSNNVAQKVNTITETGKAALKIKVAQLFTHFDHQRWEIDLAINNLNVLDKVEIEKSLTAYISKLQELLHGYGQLQKYMTDEGCPDFRLSLSIRPQYLYKAEIEWATAYLNALTKN